MSRSPPASAGSQPRHPRRAALEPAKEAQATGRSHRIGQTRELQVHYQVALHPDVDSFDVNLDRTLRAKAALKDAVVVPQEVRQEESRSGRSG
ncbi:hypothetical protein ACFP82_16205 [Cellulomonas gelida]